MKPVSINASTKIDEAILNFIYSYYVRYNRLAQLVNSEFAGSNATEVNLLIDVGDILCKVESYSKMYKVPPSNDLVLMAGLINLVAHYRQFFKSRYSCATKIWLIDSRNNTISPLYDRSFRPKVPSEQYLFDDTIFDAMCKYIPDVQYVYGRVDFATIASFIIGYHDSIFPYIAITKDPFEFQLCSRKNVWVLRPKKNGKDDVSYFVNNKNAIQCYIAETFHNSKEQLNIDSDLIGVVMALTRVPTRGLKSLYTLPTAVDMLENRIESGSIPLKYPWDPDAFFKGISVCNANCIDKNISILTNRFKAVEMVYFQLLGYKQMPESKIYNGVINLYDPKGMQAINEKYFKDYPLDLEVL